MRRARVQDGKRLFTVDDFLTAQPITSYFSPMTAKRKNVTEPEVDRRKRKLEPRRDSRNHGKASC